MELELELELELEPEFRVEAGPATSKCKCLREPTLFCIGLVEARLAREPVRRRCLRQKCRDKSLQTPARRLHGRSEFGWLL